MSAQADFEVNFCEQLVKVEKHVLFRPIDINKLGRVYIKPRGRPHY